jgi:hypothetical protein
MEGAKHREDGPAVGAHGRAKQDMHLRFKSLVKPSVQEHRRRKQDGRGKKGAPQSSSCVGIG